MRRRGLVVMVLLAVAAAIHAQEEQVPPTTLEQCDSLQREKPDTLDPYICYWIVARQQQVFSEAAARLGSIFDRDPSNHRAELYLGLVEADMLEPGAEERFRSAAEGMSKQHEFTGELYAWQSLIIYLRRSGRSEEAEKELEKAERAADATGDPSLIARVVLERGNVAIARLDYGQAWIHYKKAEAVLFPEGPSTLQGQVLGGLGSVAWALGRPRQSFDYYQRQASLLSRNDQLGEWPATLYNIALLAGQLQRDGEFGMDVVRSKLEEALNAARARGEDRIEADILLLMSQDSTRDLDDRLSMIRRSLAVARKLGIAGTEMFALRRLADELNKAGLASDKETFTLVEQAIRMATERGDLEHIARGKIVRADMRRRSGPPEQALSDALDALDAIEKIRDLQRDDMVRARWFSEFAFFYQRTAANLLASGDLGRAFEVTERMRSRILLQSLDAAGAVRSLAGPLHQRREAVLDQIARAQKRLRTPDADVDGTLAEIDRLELDERELRTQISLTDPRFALRQPEVATIEQVQSSLEEDQAMLAFHLTDVRDSGQSWVIVITSRSASAHPLGDAAPLEKAVAVYLGLLERRDQLEARAGARLHRQLLGEALADLPSRVRRLVIVPDRALHKLPFDALRDGKDRPLGALYDIVLTPSATFWLRARRIPAQPSESPLLALADPASDPVTGAAPYRGALPWVEGLRLGPLPHAREEAAAIARRLGTKSRILQGEEATEAAVKRADLSRHEILHLAAHAVIDEELPERSAVVLAPGGEDEDGLLQIRELADLDLDGRLVVLSACSTASGSVLAGEGVMGLARGFFQAGARTVVGSLWPLRDDEAAELVTLFYDYLGDGLSVGSALSSARRDRMRDGAPPAAWAGLVVLGDGDLVPFPGGLPDPDPASRGPELLQILALIAFAWIAVRRRVPTLS